MKDTPQPQPKEFTPDVPIQNIPLAEIAASPTNPRQHFDQQRIEELAATIKTTMLLSPIILRPWPAGVAKPSKKTKYELVAGERRFRAVQLNKSTEIISRIADLTNEQVIEIQLIENAQREDVHAYHQAVAFDRLLKLKNGDITEVALKLGHTEHFIAQRLSFLQLIDPLKEAFEGDEIGIGHAAVLAPLPPAFQAEAMKSLRRKEWDYKAQAHVDRIISAGELRAFVKANLMMVLSSAPWKQRDAELLPAAGSCNDCSKRSGRAPSLFDDLELGKSERCLDRECFQAKRVAFLAREVSFAAGTKTPLIQITSSYTPSPNEKAAGIIGASQYGLLKGDNKCENSVPAIVATGLELGNRARVCMKKKDRCADCTYFPSATAAPEKPLNLWERRAKDLPKKIAWAARKEVLKNILLAPAIVNDWNVPHATMNLIVYSLAGNASFEVLDALELEFAERDRMKYQDDVRHSFRTWSTAAPKTPVSGELQRMLVGLSLADAVAEFCSDEALKRLKAQAKAVDVDYDRIHTSIAAEMNAEFKSRRAKSQGGKKAKGGPAAAKKTPKGRTAAK